MGNKIRKDYFDNMGFIYKFWYRVFIGIELILPFSLIRKYIFKNTKEFSDKWVLVHTLLSIGSVFIIQYIDLGILKKIFLVYGAIRIFEMIVYQINVLLFHPYKAMVKDNHDIKNKYSIQNPYRSVVLLGHNFIEIVCWFTAASIYFSNDSVPIIKALMQNTIRIFTFNYEQVAVKLCVLQYIIFAEVLSGMILVIVSLAKFLGELLHVDLEYEQDNKNNAD
ncbi:hypothetical protein [Cellulosilyticum sp. WCF-2]|uniref:hypothetical protein n=1 Tax=Cellulosilyticum sp. WCF-2 TaxID=2497860 RepID=UPI000F8C523B|nr:hypothetical protein [Cellulosilyticum sp. WCF-2]QEH70730.1 hypothetical protein EKH84_21005 [Cellulosilyticum sp. WCF-2]